MKAPRPARAAAQVTDVQLAKFLRLGGSKWLRAQIIRAPEPKTPRVVTFDPAVVGSDTRPRKVVARAHGISVNQVDFARRKLREPTPRARY